MDNIWAICIEKENKEYKNQIVRSPVYFFLDEIVNSCESEVSIGLIPC